MNEIKQSIVRIKKYWMVNAKKSKINLTFIMKPNSLLSVTNTATNMGKHFIFPFFIFAW